MLTILKQHVCLSLILYMGVLVGRGQNVLYRKDSLKADLCTLKDSLTAFYPSLYRYHGPKEIDDLFTATGNHISDQTTDVQFYKEIKFLISSLKDGHLSSGPSKRLSKYLKSEAVFFPLRLHFDKANAYIISPLQKYSAGTLLLSIDGREIATIKNELFRYIAGDGYITSKKQLVLNSVFHFYYYLVFGKHAQFRVQLKAPDGSITTETIQAVSEAALPPVLNVDNTGELLQFEITKDNIAVLRIKSFDKSMLSENNLDFPVFMKVSFDQVHKHKIRQLIIDLRDNGGGTDLYGALLYRYLARGPFRYYRQLATITDKLPYSRLTKGVSSFNNLQPALLTKTSGGYRLKQQAHANLTLQQPVTNPYAGKVVFLINGLTFSTAAEFCTIARSKKRGLFVGQETAGAYEGNTSGVQKEIMLPNSGISITFGLIQYQMAVADDQKGRGVLPDHPVSSTLSDVIHHSDTALKLALKLLQEIN